jgi:Abnormal spindle-like microcephaly-assoc'd, ASPM-SPD-2-Hydin
MNGLFAAEMQWIGSRRADYKVVVLILALAVLVGCQGLSANNSSTPAQQTQLALASTTMNFGSVVLGSSKTLTVSATNGGTTSVSITGATSTTSEFSSSLSATPVTVAAGKSTSLTVTFAPKTAAQASATITFATSVGSAFLAVTGDGTAPPQLQGIPTSVSFGAVSLGNSQAETGLLTNNGPSSITISQATLTGSAFRLSGLSLPATLSAGQSLSFAVVFAPTVAGSASGNISVTSNAADSTLNIALSGSGTSTVTTSGSGQLAISPSSFNFGSVLVGLHQSQAGTLTASGDNVTISAPPASSGAFAVSGISFPLTIAAGQSTPFTLTFTPQTGGATSANFSFVSNASDSPGVVSATGTGVARNHPVAHGMFILNPPTSDGDCGGFPANCYSKHLVPTFICTGNGAPAGYNCTQQGAGEPYIEGAVFQVAWSTVNPADGTYSFSKADKLTKAWTDSGKLVSFVFEPTAFGTSNGATPQWYMTPVDISTVSQTGGIITVQTSTPMNFFPGGATSAAGLEIQISGTGTALDGNGTSANPGIWTVCDHTTAGCEDPSAQTVYAVGTGGDITATKGTVRNPVYGSNSGATCSSGIIPIQWRPNFIKAWQAFIQQALAYYATNTHVSYIRFGMGIGGQTNPTYGMSATDAHQNACEAQMTTYGFTSLAAPWPDPTTPQWPQVSKTWAAFLKVMTQYEGILNSPKAIIITTSPIMYSPDDLHTPDAIAADAAGAGVGFGNQGLGKNDPINHAAGNPCYGGDWCANFQKYKGQVPLELQTLSYSDPTDVSQTGSLANTVPFAVTMGAQILELYGEDWFCTYDSSWKNINTHAACTAAGYPAVFAAAAAKIN